MNEPDFFSSEHVFVIQNIRSHSMALPSVSRSAA